MLDLLNLPRPKSASPWAYVKIAEGCDRSCGFCAIPSFRGPQRSRDVASILDEVEQLEAQEIVLVAQDLASYGKDRPDELGAGSIVPLVKAVSAVAPWTRLLYLYPSDLTDELIDAILATGVPYFDLSLQHVSKPLLRRMRRWGDGDRFLRRIDDIRERQPDAAFRSNFIVGYPGETEEDHDQLLRLRRGGRARLVRLLRVQRRGRHVRGGSRRRGRLEPDERAARRAARAAGRHHRPPARRADRQHDRRCWSTRPGVARSSREAPEIDGIIEVPDGLGGRASSTRCGSWTPWDPTSWQNRTDARRPISSRRPGPTWSPWRGC